MKESPPPVWLGILEFACLMLAGAALLVQVSKDYLGGFLFGPRVWALLEPWAPWALGVFYGSLVAVATSRVATGRLILRDALWFRVLEFGGFVLIATGILLWAEVDFIGEAIWGERIWRLLRPYSWLGIGLSVTAFAAVNVLRYATGRPVWRRRKRR